LFNQNWSKEKYKILARNISEFLLRVNKLSYYVGTIILLLRKHKTRAKVISKIINMAKACYDINNLNSFMGLMTGLGMSPISRLKHSWSKVPQGQIQVFKVLEGVQNPTSSFKTLREHMGTIGDPKHSKCIPYVGTHLGDITFTDEGNPNFIGDDKLINITKFHLITKSINSFLKYQVNLGYEHFEIEEPAYTYLYTLPHLDEKELFDLSIVREPRNSLIKDIE